MKMNFSKKFFSKILESSRFNHASQIENASTYSLDPCALENLNE